MASENGHAECVQALLGGGADPNQIKAQNGDFALLTGHWNLTGIRTHGVPFDFEKKFKKQFRRDTNFKKT